MVAKAAATVAVKLICQKPRIQSRIETTAIETLPAAVAAAVFGAMSKVIASVSSIPNS
jgi:hypothetical protein